MPPRDVSPGQDEISVAIYLADGPDDAGLLAWQRDHPDAFEAGRWMPSPDAGNRPRQADAAKRAGPDVGQGGDRAPLDPSTLSMADFRAVADDAKRGTRPGLTPAPGPPDPDAPA